MGKSTLNHSEMKVSLSFSPGRAHTLLHTWMVAPGLETLHHSSRHTHNTRSDGDNDILRSTRSRGVQWLFKKASTSMNTAVIASLCS